MNEYKDFLIKRNSQDGNNYKDVSTQKNVDEIVIYDCGQIVKKLSIKKYMEIKKNEMELRAKNFITN